jgi:predicted permease
VLISAQVAFSFMLLIGAGLMVRSFMQLQQVDTGFVTQRVFAVSFDLNWSKYKGEYRDVSRRLLARTQAQPGVAMAAISSSFPMDPDLRVFGGRPTRIKVEGETRTDLQSVAVKHVRVVSPDYFKTLGIPVIAGRAFLDSDRREAPQVVLINRTLAAKRFDHEDPVGRRIQFNNSDQWAKIVGVVGDVKEFGPDTDAPYEMYLPMEQSTFPGALLVRSIGDPQSVAGVLRRAILDVDPQTAIVDFETLEQAKAKSLQSPRTATSLFSTFAVLAFVIAVAGITSMLALWVKQRKREIGIRMALGASPRSIVGEVLRQGMLLVGIGLAVGVAGALAMTRWMKVLLFQIQPNDIWTFVVASVLLLAAALLACLAPARKASLIDPQTALRAD